MTVIPVVRRTLIAVEVEALAMTAASAMIVGVLVLHVVHYTRRHGTTTGSRNSKARATTGATHGRRADQHGRAGRIARHGVAR